MLCCLIILMLDYNSKVLLNLYLKYELFAKMTYLRCMDSLLLLNSINILLRVPETQLTSKKNSKMEK